MATENPTLVARLIESYDLDRMRRWENQDDYYIAASGVSTDDVPRLIQLVRQWTCDGSAPIDDELDDGLDSEPLLPVMAWQALGDLKSPEAVGPILEMLTLLGNEFDDWASEDLPYVFRKIGSPALAELLAYVADCDNPTLARSIVVRGIGKIVESEPDTRSRVVPALIELLSHFEDQSIEFNTALMTELHDLQATEAGEVIERAFSANAIDCGMMGDWNKVRAELGVDGLGLPMPAKPCNSLADLQDRIKGAFEAQLANMQFEEREADTDITPQRLLNTPVVPAIREARVGRNESCTCGSGRKYKKCCGR